MSRSLHRCLVSALAALAALLALAAPAGAAGFGPLGSFGSLGSGPGQVSAAEDIAVGPDGSAYVADYQNYRVDVFGPDGSFSFAFGQQVNPKDGSDVCTSVSGCVAGERNGTAGALGGPAGVAVGADGTVFVSEYENNRISAFSPGGKFLYAFGKGVAVAGGGDVCSLVTECQMGPNETEAGAMYNPAGIAVSPSGDVYVADTQNWRVDVFSPQGKFLFAFARSVAKGPSDAGVCDAASGCEKGDQSAAAGAIAPADVAVAPDGRVLVSDSFRRVSVFNAGGAFLYAFGRGVDAGSGGDRCTTNCTEGAATPVAGAIPNPHGIGISPSPLSGSDLFVADGVDNRVAEFTLDGQFVKAFGVSWPTGLAVDCRGAVLVGEYAEGPPESAWVERFAEAGTAPPSSCPAAPAPSPVTPIAAPSNRFQLGKLKLDRKRGTATLLVTVPGAGRLVLTGKGLKKATHPVGRAGTVKLPVNPTGKAKRKLAATGGAKVKASVTFTPTGGSARTKTKRLTLRAALGR